MFIFAAALAVAMSSSASNALPDAPVATTATVVNTATVKHNFNRYDYALYAGVVGYHVADCFTTWGFLSRGGRELELPTALVENKPGFAAYSLGLAAGEIAASVYLHKHGHAKLARFADSLSIAAGTATDISNTQVTRKGGGIL